MRWCNGFGRSLLFALLVALAYPVYRAVVGAAVLGVASDGVCDDVVGGVVHPLNLGPRLER